jgi:hypothetical protein
MVAMVYEAAVSVNADFSGRFRAQPDQIGR